MFCLKRRVFLKLASFHLVILAALLSLELLLLFSSSSLFELGKFVRTATKIFKYQPRLFLKTTGSIYTELFSFNIKNPATYRFKHVNLEIMYEQSTNKVFYFFLFSTRIITRLLPKEPLRLQKSNTWDIIFVCRQKAI